jgi:hypothetical protein
VRLYGLQVRDLVRRAAVQIGAASTQQRNAGRILRERDGPNASPRVAISTSPSWMSSTDSGFFRPGIETLQSRGRVRCLRGRSGQRERCAAMRNGDVERSLDLPQVRVERPAQVRQRAVVERCERQFFDAATG